MPSPPRLLAVLALALLTLVSACGEDVPEQITPLGPRKPLKVQHAMGETRVPYRAERPATLDPSAMETALALGVKPVGSATPDGKGFPTYLGKRTRGVEDLGPARDPDVKKTLALDPDVVIGNKLLNKRVYKPIDGKEPIVMSGIPIREWKSDVRFFGEALGLSDEGEALLTDYDKRVTATKRALGATTQTPAELLRSLPADLRRELSPSFLADVFQDVGLKPPASTGQGKAGGLIAARLVLDGLRRGAAVEARR